MSTSSKLLILPRNVRHAEGEHAGTDSSHPPADLAGATKRDGPAIPAGLARPLALSAVQRDFMARFAAASRSARPAVTVSGAGFAAAPKADSAAAAQGAKPLAISRNGS